MFSASASLSVPTASAPMLMPPLQTWFQLLPVLCDQPTLFVYCVRPGVESLVDDRRADRVAPRLRPVVVKPVVADGAGVRHLGGVEEVRGMPVGNKALSATVLSSVHARSAYCASPVSCHARPSLYMRSTTVRDSLRMVPRTSGA